LAGINKLTKDVKILHHDFEFTDNWPSAPNRNKMRTKIQWIVINKNIYSHKIQSPQYAQKVIQDVHFGCLSKYVQSSLNNNTNFVISDEIKEQISKCNDEILKDWGISMKIISLTIENKFGKSDT